MRGWLDTTWLLIQTTPGLSSDDRRDLSITLMQIDAAPTTGPEVPNH